MPVFEQRLAVMIRNLRAFLNLQAGVTRSEAAPRPPWLPRAEQNGELEEARRQLTSKNRELKRLRAGSTDGSSLADDAIRGAGAQESLRTEQLIWMFGHSRTGSTWLSWMMAELENQERWHEPYVGMLFGSFIYQKLKGNHMALNNPTFIMAVSQVLPLLPVPKIQITFSGLRPPASITVALLTSRARNSLSS